MKQRIIFLAWLLMSSSAYAEVFRCKGESGMVYSERPCASDAAVVNHLAKKPSEENAREASSRLDRTLRQIEEKDRQEDIDRRSRSVSRGSWGR